MRTVPCDTVPPRVATSSSTRCRRIRVLPSLAMEPTVQFHHDYNLGDPSGPFGLGPLVANGASNTQLAPTGGGTRTIANPLELKFGLTVDDVAGDTTSLTFTGPITFTSTAGRLIQNLLPGSGGTLTFGSATSPSTFTLAATSGLTLTFQGSGKTVINDVIQDSPGVPMNVTINSAQLPR